MTDKLFTHPSLAQATARATVVGQSAAGASCSSAMMPLFSVVLALDSLSALGVGYTDLELLTGSALGNRVQR